MDNQLLLSLAETIQEEAKSITGYLKTQHGTPQASQPMDLPHELPKSVHESRQRLRGAAKELYDITFGAYDHLMNLAWDYHNVSSLRWILHFKLPQAIAFDSSVAYADLANTCNVNESNLRRILGFCMTNNLFQEPSPDRVSHSAYSAALVKKPNLVKGLEFATEETFPVSVKLVEAHDQESNAHRTAFSILHNTDLTPYAFMSLPGNEARFRRFKGCMTFLRDDPAQDIQHMVSGYPWSTATAVIDIGGSVGEVAIALARAHSHLNIIVQDLASAVTTGTAHLPPDLHPRISFTEHDFFTPQPSSLSTGKETYFLRFILQHWPDSSAIKILQNLLPGLKAGARLVIADIIMPTPESRTVPKAMERYMRQWALEMMQQHDGIERRRVE